MKINEFISNYNTQRFMNTKNGVDERSEYFKKELGIKAYIPFREKRKIAEMIVAQNVKEVDGIKKYDNIDSYISLVVASIAAHTNLQFSDDPVVDYDLLAESGLLPQIIAEFQGSHDEIDILLKMALESELDDNNIEALVGRFLDKILKRIDDFGAVLKNTLGDFNLKDIFGADFKEEDLAELTGLLDKLK